MAFAETVEDLKNKYTGERIFILGNGPSLPQTPFDSLASEYTLGLNKIGRLYPETDWRPSFYYNPLGPDHSLAPTDLSIVVDNCDNETVCFLNSSWSGVPKTETNVFYFDIWSLFGSPLDTLSDAEIRQQPSGKLSKFWSDDIADIVYHYHSMYGAVQVAAYLGFDEIYFVGCDFGMEYDNPHMVFESGLDPYRYDGGKLAYLRDSLRQKNTPQSLVNAVAMKLILSLDTSYLNKLFHSDRDDHFTSDYFDTIVIQDGEQHEDEIRKGHLLAKRICEQNGIEMYNATLGGELEVYDRVELRSVIDD